MKTKTLLPFAVAAFATTVATAAVVRPAEAATVSYSASTGSALITTDLVNEPLDFTAPLPKFLIPGQKLTGVSISITGEMLIRNLSITNTAQQTQTFNYLQNAQLSITSGNTPINLPIGSFANLQVVQNGITIAPGATQTFSDLSDTDTVVLTFLPTDPGFDQFKGPGNIELLASTLVSQTLSGGGGNGIATFNTLAGASAEVTYTYEQVPITDVPEPSAAVALGAVALGFGGLLKKKI